MAKTIVALFATPAEADTAHPGTASPSFQPTSTGGAAQQRRGREDPERRS